jgi:hypothetical protein
LPLFSIFSALLMIGNNLGSLALICPQYRHFDRPPEEGASTTRGGLIPGLIAEPQAGIVTRNRLGRSKAAVSRT